MPKQYLQRYAEPEITSLITWPLWQFNQALVIPVFAEKPEFLLELLQKEFTQLEFKEQGFTQQKQAKNIRQPEQCQDLLIVLVINQPANTPVHLDNVNLAQHLDTLGENIWQVDNLKLINLGQKAVLIVDRFSPGRQIPIKQGVGLARKVGCDLALALCVAGAIRSSWIYTTDADAHLPQDYFRLPAGKNIAAAVLPFIHRHDRTAIGEATRLYEQAIRYYARGLVWAGSHYGFVALGSAMAVDAISYAKVRGFPKRAGGEDFYLLNKLAKIGKILQPEGSAIEINARISDRVPFGTGPAVKAITELPDGSEYCYYHPQLFHGLKTWLTAVASMTGDSDLDAKIRLLPEPIQQVLEQLNIAEIKTHIRRQGFNPSQTQTALLDWFDGFRTLKFIRHLQAAYRAEYPDLPLAQCLANGDF